MSDKQDPNAFELLDAAASSAPTVALEIEAEGVHGDSCARGRVDRVRAREDVGR